MNHENDPQAGQVFTPPPLHSTLRWPLLLPGLLWLVGLLCYLREGAAPGRSGHLGGDI